MSSVSPTGTLAFLLEEEALLVRVAAGWQYVAVSDGNDQLAFVFPDAFDLVLCQLYRQSIQPLYRFPSQI